MKKFLLSIVATLALVGVSQARVAEWRTFTSNDDNIYTSGWDGIQLFGFDDVHLTAHFGEYINETIVDATFTVAETVCDVDGFEIGTHGYVDGDPIATQINYTIPTGTCLVSGDTIDLEIRVPEAGNGLSIFIESTVMTPDRVNRNGKVHPHAQFHQTLFDGGEFTINSVRVFGVLGGIVEH